MKRALLTLSLAFCLLPGVAQKLTIRHLEPANWWTGMKNPDVQLLVHGPAIGAATVTLEYPGVVLKEITKAESPNYLFLTLSIAPDAPAGRVPLVFRRGKARLTHAYELRPRSTDTTRIRGFSAADLIYLIMPDRFANGDPQNDRVAGMKEGADRRDSLGRHGGDLKGIADRLDYVKDLGATALWLNPVQANDQEKASYHGYAITDYYRVDPRFGTNEAYKSLVEGSHAKGLKVIMDLVHNHCGSGHWWMQDLPVRDWIHQPDSAWPSYRSNFRSSVISDPYASDYDRRRMNNGWFDSHMPDLNQQNPLLATYLIQNSLWWIEYAGIDGIRMDTYPYPDPAFMARWCSAVLAEYPQFGLVGEVWVTARPRRATGWRARPTATGTCRPAQRDGLPAVLCRAEGPQRTGRLGHGAGPALQYLAQDFAYRNPAGHVIFLDNHDLGRFYYEVGKDLDKFKMGWPSCSPRGACPNCTTAPKSSSTGPAVRTPTCGSTSRAAGPAIPSTPSRPPAAAPTKTRVRLHPDAGQLAQGKKGDSPGQAHAVCAGRQRVRLLPLRRPGGRDGGDERQREAKTIQTARYAERLKGYNGAKDVATGTPLSRLDQITIPARTALVLELER
jgi:hypothetical protein